MTTGGLKKKSTVVQNLPYQNIICAMEYWTAMMEVTKKIAPPVTERIHSIVTTTGACPDMLVVTGMTTVGTVRTNEIVRIGLHRGPLTPTRFPQRSNTLTQKTW
uniref:Uncharacterized protein n=1 Tax=Cacopsylla melanoneura TaxID=428564 RepID=A0A8D8LIM4_9HEMI